MKHCAMEQRLAILLLEFKKEGNIMRDDYFACGGSEDFVEDEEMDFETTNREKERARKRRKKEQNYKQRVRRRIRDNYIAAYEENGIIKHYSIHSPWDKAEIKREKRGQRRRMKIIEDESYFCDSENCSDDTSSLQ